MPDETTNAAFGHLLALLVHDLRNPAATVGANVDFLREVEIPDEDARDALDDVGLALDELKRGLTQIGWIARWLAGEKAFSPADGDAGPALKKVAALRGVRLELEDGPLRAKGGAGVGDLVLVLLDNAERHARGKDVVLSAARTPAGGVVVRLVDGGTPVAPELAEAAFSIAGQQLVKGKAEGRYGRFAGLVAVRAALEGLGGTLTAGADEDGQSRFELTLPPA